ncbi:DUF2147 domain-containing protein [Sphingomonas sp. AR_OL41]|uniref:DUF2147 domain-containing protein n=1 Tax=Sphingomonas sp. AR_OL41 TaxID=3042729 RepID=UPI0024818EC3|nr:DUF2147 domain-containing protein [Sphingomonas sp. AR_OL41]MDH7972371.1 DUF2147 domain-containing protein [Sphingomonas sp. AR_OL41]
MRIAAFALLLLLFAVPAQAAAPITGRWITKDAKALVEIAPCGANICGHIIRILSGVKNPPTTDIRNPDHAQRQRPLVGLPVIFNLAERGDKWQGKLYSPEDGLFVKGTLSRNADGTLAVHGCAYLFICRDQVWHRAP